VQAVRGGASLFQLEAEIRAGRRTEIVAVTLEPVLLRGETPCPAEICSVSAA
jgi:hypothetical protein